MYVLAKQTDDGVVTLHGLTDEENVAFAWFAADQLVFDIDPADTTSSDAYTPWQEEEAE